MGGEKDSYEEVPHARKSDIRLQPYEHIDPSDKSDLIKWSQSREQGIREEMIAAERLRILRNKMAWCYKKEGVNHYVKCRHLTKRYWEMLDSGNFGAPLPGKATPGAPQED
ncbi:unnamed protein product [Chrysoparadoxa australica]